MMSDVLDSFLEAMKINFSTLEKEAEKDNTIENDVLLIKQQQDLIESAIMSVYAQVNAIDAKFQEKWMNS